MEDNRRLYSILYSISEVYIYTFIPQSEHFVLRIFFSEFFKMLATVEKSQMSDHTENENFKNCAVFVNICNIHETVYGAWP